MRRVHLSSSNLYLLIFLIFGFVVSCRTAFPLGFDTKFFGISLDATSTELISSLGLSDPGNYMRVAVDLQDLTLSAENSWILNLWPPGMPLYLTVLTFISGNGNPTAIATLIFISLWSVLYAILMNILISKRYFFLSVVFSYLWLFSPLLTGYNTDYGLLASDGISSVIMAFVVILMFRLMSKRIPMTQNMFVLSVVIGFIWAIAAHFRMVWTFAIFASIVFSYFLFFLGTQIRRRSNNQNLDLQQSNVLFLFSIASLVFVILLIPWTLIGEAKLHPGNYNWSNGNYVWAQRWMSDQYLTDGGAGFLVEGNANWSCEIDKIQCNEIANAEIAAGTFYSGYGPYSHSELRNRALLSAIESPLHWLKIMTTKLFETWVTIPGASIGSAPNLLGGILTIFAYIASLFFLIRNVITTNNIFALFMFFISTFAIAILYLEHFESRYLIPTQVLGIVILICYLDTQGKSGSIKDRFLRTSPFVSSKES